MIQFVRCSLVLLAALMLFSCSTQREDSIMLPSSTPSETIPPINPVEPVQNKPEVENEPEKEQQFIADFTITLGTHETGADLLQSLEEGKFRTSKWSKQALSNPDFPVAEEEHQVDVFIISLLDMGFLENELVPLKAILKKGEKLGFEVCPPELAAQLRLQYIDQPDWSTGDRLGEFFVASEPVDLYDDGVLKIFSIHRDDKFPHEETGIGLWLISNNVVDAADANHRERLFNPSDEKGEDLGGRFAFIIPK